MSRVKLDKDKILKKFKSLSMTAMSIQKTSKYMYQFFKSSDTIVSLWHQAMHSASDQSKISLFYIANEMLQSRNYGSSNFKQSWKSQLPQSLDLIKNSSINDKIIRMFNIWIERHVYDQSFIEELISKISSTRSPVNDEEAKFIILNFEPDDAIEKLKTLIKIESEVTETMKHIDITALNFDEKSCKEAIKKLKDKTHCNEFTGQLDSTINQLFRISTLMEEELKIRKSTLKIMENAEIYYQTQLSETLIVEDAYKRYGNLISKTKDALEEHLDFLMDDVGPIDIDDAPSPGKTPPYLYEDPVKKISELKNDSPMSFQDVVSPTQSMDMSEDDTPMDSSTYLDNKPYSPSNEVDTKLDTNITSKTTSEDSKPSLSCSDALKILTSVFTQSLTKKVTPEPEARVHLQPDIFRNTLSSSSTIANDQIDNTNSSSKPDNSDSVVADAFRLISNLTGMKNISERNYKSETSTTSSGTTIPILTSKCSFRSISNEPEKVKPDIFPFSQSNYPTVNVSSNCDTISHTLFPDVQKSFSNIFNQHPVNNNQIFPLLGNHSGLPPQPPPPMFNPMSNNHLPFNLNILNKDNNQNNKKSPGSCTEDEDDGGATPTQDEPVIHQNTSTVFNQNVMPALHPNADEINKQLQNVMNASGNPFGMSTMLTNNNEPATNPGLQQPQWNLQSQFPFNMNNPNVQPSLNMPFNLISQNPPIQPSFSPVNNSAKPLLNFGPPRAIRTKRPNPDSGTSQTNSSEAYSAGSSIDFNLTPPPPPPPKSDKDVSNTDEQPAKQPDSNTKAVDKESELLNLYGDVEEEIDRNYNFSQQNINVRNSRPPPPSDRYHLYNQSTPPIMGFRFPDHSHANMINNNNTGMNTNTNNSIGSSGHGSLSTLANNMNTGNRMGYPHTPFNFRNQFPRSGPTMYFPNRTTNFRPRNNYNMFN